MKRRSAIRDLAMAGAVSSLPRLLNALTQAEPKDLVIRSDVRLVLLDVSVRDHRGGLVAGLLKENFAVAENGVRQPVTVFANNDLPVTVGVLVDESRSMTPKRAEVLAAAETFIRESNPHDEIFVLNFSDKVKRGLPEGVLFSDNIAQLRQALHRMLPEGKTALHDAVKDGLEQLKLGRRDKKALVVISDGGDNASKHDRREMFEEIEGNIATIYAIGLFDLDAHDKDPGILKQMAKISGGEAYFPASVAGMPAVCRAIAADMRTRYTIGYLPKPSSGPGQLRHIGVRVSAPGHARLIARTRTLYRYEAGQE